METPLVVDTAWLLENRTEPGIEVLENAWIKEAYDKAHIDGACCVPGHPYLKHHNAAGERTPHVMKPDEFKRLCQDLGIRKTKQYVVYDDYYGLFAARFWYVCRYFGVNNISILNGSWRGWLEQGGAVSSHIVFPGSGSDVVVSPSSSLMIGLDELLHIYSDSTVQLWDTRRPGEFSGEEETANSRRGHIPGAFNLEWTALLTEPAREGGARYLKPLSELRDILKSLGLSRDKTIITYCQSGNRAAFCNLVLEWLGFPHHRLYDASMNEWANLSEPPLLSI